MGRTKSVILHWLQDPSVIQKAEGMAVIAVGLIVVIAFLRSNHHRPVVAFPVLDRLPPWTGKKFAGALIVAFTLLAPLCALIAAGVSLWRLAR